MQDRCQRHHQTHQLDHATIASHFGTLNFKALPFVRFGKGNETEMERETQDEPSFWQIVRSAIRQIGEKNDWRMTSGE